MVWCSVVPSVEACQNPIKTHLKQIKKSKHSLSAVSQLLGHLTRLGSVLPSLGLGYFYTVALGCLYSPRVEVILTPHISISLPSQIFEPFCC